MFNIDTLRKTVGVLVAGMMLVHCGTPQDESETSVEGIQQALDDENGGLTMSDEQPAFGLADLDADDVDPAATDVPEPPADVDAADGEVKDPTRPPSPCPHGLLKGRWIHLAKGFGVFRGKWATKNGKVVGHLKGIYGRNSNGHGVFFGKYIDQDGRFRGLLKGRYGKGYFKGRWHGKSGMRGMLRGVYGRVRCNAADKDVRCGPGKGFFVGGWRAFCPKCAIACIPGYRLADDGCYCVPADVKPCQKNSCPEGMFCDPCPPLPGCNVANSSGAADTSVCPAVCGAPRCRPLPPKSDVAPDSEANTDNADVPSSDNAADDEPSTDSSNAKK